MIVMLSALGGTTSFAAVIAPALTPPEPGPRDARRSAGRASMRRDTPAGQLITTFHLWTTLHPVWTT